MSTTNISINPTNPSSRTGVIDIRAFLQNLTHFLKLGIYANKGTEDENLLKHCIKLYNKYKLIEMSDIDTDEEIALVRKSLKRINLVLKTDADGAAINISDKDSQRKILQYQPHAALLDGRLNDLYSFADHNHIAILTGVPLTFILKPSKFQGLTWQYLRVVFNMTQILLAKDHASTQHIYQQAITQVADILESIACLEKENKVNQLMAVDHFLNNKLVKTTITEQNLADAKEEVKGIFRKKGLDSNNTVFKMIDSITDKVPNLDLSQGNVLKSMMGIAQDVVKELAGDIRSDPQQFQTTISTLTEVFQEQINDPNGGATMPPQFKGMMDLLSATSKMSDQSSADQFTIELEKFIDSTGIGRDRFMNEAGEPDINKFQQYVSTFAPDMVNQSQIAWNQAQAVPNQAVPNQAVPNQAVPNQTPATWSSINL